MYEISRYGINTQISNRRSRYENKHKNEKRKEKKSKNLTNVEASKNYVKKKLKHDFGIESGGSRRRFVGIEDTRVTDLCY